MNELKYLPNGKKVAVIGMLNNVEHIVQEIFVTEDGSEIPSGEKFTTKNLLDEPAISYQKKEEKRAIENRDALKKEAEELSNQIRKLKSERKAHSELVRSNLNLIENLPDLDWEFMSDVLTGNIKWALEISSWRGLEPRKFDDVIYYFDGFHGIRMLQVFGTTRRRGFDFRLSRYPDGTGDYITYKFFRDDDELKEYLKEAVEEKAKEGKLTLSDIDNVKEFVDVDRELIKKLYDAEAESLLFRMESSVKSNKESYEESMKKIEKYK